MNEDLLRDAIANPRNMGEMSDADSVGTVGSPDCGDMVRLWLKFREQDGRKVIDKASFQSFGCQTAIAVASVATELLSGKTVEEARALDATDLSQPLGPLPPMKIHCGQMVEGALRQALEADKDDAGQDGANSDAAEPSAPPRAPTLHDALGGGPAEKGKVRIVKLDS